MNFRKSSAVFVLFILILVSFTTFLSAQSELKLHLNADLVSKYLWRGLVICDAPCLQPALSFEYSDFSWGIWGSYALAHNQTGNDENDFWISYSRELDNSMTVTALLIDYYFANAGIQLFNFNNHDDPDGPGAHTVEAGLQITGPETLPVTVSAYINVYNDAGSSTYFELSIPKQIHDTACTLFIGASPGSKDNPAYYGADSFAVLNVGFSASREIQLTQGFSLPVSMSFVVNPEEETSYLIAGISF
ncbi:TorF family putative porin [candidate division KSB1 bacterium]